METVTLTYDAKQLPSSADCHLEKREASLDDRIKQQIILGCTHKAKPKKSRLEKECMNIRKKYIDLEKRENFVLC